jgi:hypothetical protein
LTRVRRAQECLDADGGQFHYLLWRLVLTFSLLSVFIVSH